MTDAPVDLDDAFEKLHAELFTLKGYGLLDALIAELRAARAPVEAEASWQVAWERVCPEAARSARLGWFDGKNKREGFEAGYLAAQSRAAPPADEVAGLLDDVLAIRRHVGGGPGGERRVDMSRRLDRIENHLKGKR
jgi:hypothetical protein